MRLSELIKSLDRSQFSCGNAALDDYFHVCGNNYRLVVAVAYRIQTVYVKFFGKHAEYDKIDAATVEVK